MLAALANRGFAASQEAGRSIIRQQLAQGGDALPWADKAAYAEAMFSREVASFGKYAKSYAPIFFDRGLPDVIGYLKLCGLAVPKAMDEHARRWRYSQLVFMAPPWREIYCHDNERRQQWDEATATYEVMLKTYTDYGYQTIDLPLVSVEKRVEFILQHISC